MYSILLHRKWKTIIFCFSYGEHEATVKLHKAVMQIDLLQTEVQRLVTASLSVEKEVGKREDPKSQVSAKAMEFVEALKSKKEKISQVIFFQVLFFIITTLKYSVMGQKTKCTLAPTLLCFLLYKL